MVIIILKKYIKLKNVDIYYLLNNFKYFLSFLAPLY